MLCANLLFQFGSVEESENIKKSKNAIEEVRKKREELPDAAKDELLQKIQQINTQKQQFLEFAAGKEQESNYIQAVVAYQQALKNYCQLADTDNAVSLLGKIRNLLQKIPNLMDEIKRFETEAAKLASEGKAENAEIQKQFANTLKEAAWI
jgi:transcription elongation factor GreA-like protein